MGLAAAWTAFVELLKRLWLAFDARAGRQADQAALQAETRAAEREQREAEREASSEAMAVPGRDVVAGRLRDGGF